MKKALFYMGSVIQNIVLVVAFIVAGFEAARDGLSKDAEDYKTYELLQSKKVFK